MLTQIMPFAELPADELQPLGACLQRRRYSPGEVIFLHGDPGTSLYFIVAGEVKITLSSPEGGEVVLARLGPGAFFGELALLDQAPRSADAVATAASELLLLPRAAFLQLLAEQPSVVLHLLTIVSERLRQDVQLLQDLAFLEIPTRLAKVLLRLMETQGQSGEDGVIIAARLTQTELAGLVGATRESVNKWLGVFERRGLIRRQRGHITVLRPDGLRRCLTHRPPGGPVPPRRPAAATDGSRDQQSRV